jgi:hypothetical protein
MTARMPPSLPSTCFSTSFRRGLEGLVDGQHFFDTVADEMSGPKYWPVKKRNQLGRRRKAAN